MCVGFALFDVVCDELNDCAWKTLLRSSATAILYTGIYIWLNLIATVLFNVCSDVTVEWFVLYPCCMGVFGMFSVMKKALLQCFGITERRAMYLCQRICLLCELRF